MCDITTGLMSGIITIAIDIQICHVIGQSAAAVSLFCDITTGSRLGDTTAGSLLGDVTTSRLLGDISTDSLWGNMTIGIYWVIQICW